MPSFLLVIFIAGFLTAPLYVWRFEISAVSLNALLVILTGIIAAVFGYIVLKGKWKAFWQSILNLPNLLLILIAIFFLASVVSLITGGFDIPKLGQWIVLYAQPLTIFFLLRFYLTNGDKKRIEEAILISVYALVGVAGLLAILQYTTFITLPADWWGNANEPKRAIAFFSHPNAYALFVTPILAWLLPDLLKRFILAKQKLVSTHSGFFLLWCFGMMGMFLSLSRGAWIGFAAALVIFALHSRNKKIILSIVGLGIIATGIIAATPNLRYRVTLPFQGEKSAVARFSLWDTGLKMIADDPVLGKGIHGFNYNWEKYNTDPNLQHYNFPHNVLLNFWIDLGLVGALSFIGICIFAIWRGLKKTSNSAVLGFSLFVIAILVHGLIDIPYLKNDLALVFWFLFALAV